MGGGFLKRLLLDTHAFLWFVFNDSRLSDRAKALIPQQDTVKLLSVASLWEITIKSQLGKLTLGTSLDEFFEECVERRLVETVGIELAHLVAYSNLPLLHRDPFDRLIVAQAQTLRVPILSGDHRFADYGVEVVW